MGLAHFQSQLVEKANPIFQILRKADRFKWTDDYEVAFQELKMMLAFPLILVKRIEGQKRVRTKSIRLEEDV
ncbi:hypothetical protein CR513_16165, partial [Mucuna pruriens]